MGKQVKRFREIRGWSQQELARKMLDRGHSWRQTTVAKTEAADRPIRVNEAQDLATLFGVSVEDLLTIPAEDVALAHLTVRVGELRARRAAALEALQEAEEAKQHAEELVERTSAELREARHQLEVHKANRKVPTDGE